MAKAISSATDMKSTCPNVAGTPDLLLFRKPLMERIVSIKRMIVA